MHKKTESGAKATSSRFPPNIRTACACSETLHRQGGRGQRTGADQSMLGCKHPDCPYRYLTWDESTTEAFKIRLRNVHPYGGFRELKKLLTSRNVKFRKVKYFEDIAYLTFRSIEDRDEAVVILDGLMWRGRRFEARVAPARADPLLLKRAMQSVKEMDPPAKKRPCLQSPSPAVDEQDEETRLHDAVTPLWRLEYDPDQLAKKRESALAGLGMVRAKIVDCNRHLKSILPVIEAKNMKRPICELSDVIPSPVTTDYRNKCELTIGYDLQGNGPIVGFRFTKYRDGLTAVGPFKHVNILPKSAVSILESLQQFIDQYTPAAPTAPFVAYDPINHRGQWRYVLVRVTRLGDRLLLVDLCPYNLSTEALDHVSKALHDWFSNDGPGNSVGLTSLYISNRRPNVNKFDSSDTRLLFGKKDVTELCCGLKFRISLNAFFQVNTPATEILYEQISQLLASPSKALSNTKEEPATETNATDLPKRQRILLDVCCGTGTIGICLAKDFDRVIGIELDSSAVEDAKYNATANGVQNIQFYSGKAEEVIFNVLNTLPDDADLFAVVDPPRAGLNVAVVQALRRCSRLQRIVFAACNWETSMHNFVEFARPISNRFLGTPFVPVAATAVDLFPQTNYVEVLLLLERAHMTDQAVR